jgi:hypothetical protein
MYIVWDHIILCFGCKRDSLVLILPIPAYLGIKAGQFCFRLQDIFSAVILRTYWRTTICIMCPILREIDCDQFVCNKFVLVILQIDIRQCVYHRLHYINLQ